MNKPKMIEHVPPSDVFDGIELDLYAELDNAEENFPEWPTDLAHGMAILGEEYGEAVKATVDFAFHDGSIDDIREELVQLGAMVFRQIAMIDRIKSGEVES